MGIDERPENIMQEDATKYGEFISSFDSWLTFEEQKKRANHLTNNTKLSQME